MKMSRSARVVILLVACALIQLNDIRAQYSSQRCAFTGMPSTPAQGGGVNWNCVPGSDWFNHYRTQSKYIPNGSPEIPAAIKTIGVKVIVWHRTQTDPDNYVLSDTPDIQAVIEQINEQFTNVALPSDPATFITPEWLTDSRLRFEFRGVHFLVNQTHWSVTVEGDDFDMLHDAMNATVHDAVSGSETCLLIHIPGPGALGRTPPIAPEDFDAHRAIVTPQHTAEVAFAFDAEWMMNNWTHEIGHFLGLNHVYANFPYAANGTDGAREACNGQPDRLADVFGLPNNWCLGDDIIWDYPSDCNDCFFRQTQNAEPDAALYDGNTNNLMGNNDINDFISPMQAGRMHRTLMTASASQYAWGYSTEPWFIDVDRTLDWPMKVYQDVVVRTGATLTITCEIHMVPEARIIVEPGARLIIDGGTITIPRHATQRWQGVVVQGDFNLPQTATMNPPYLDYQGYMEMRNDAKIMHALYGVSLGHTATGGGGVIVIDGNPGSFAGSFINCRTALDFAEYQVGQTGPNTSVLEFVRFERNEDFLPENEPLPILSAAFVNISSVRDLTFRGCEFVNTQPGVTESHLLGQGIRAFNSRIHVLPGCPGISPCPTAQESESVFIGLDHAVEAFSSGGAHALTIRKADFSNNVCGVYTNGLVGVSVTQNKFILGNNPVALTHPDEDPWWDEKHRGIYTYNSWGLRIRDNTMDRELAAPTDNTEGIVIGYSRDHNDVVYQNEVEDLYRGFIGEGICAETYGGNQGFIGLQFRCNTNTANNVNIWSRRVYSVDLDEQTRHSIRTHQGYQVAADNLFDNWEEDDAPNVDYYIDTDWRIRYRYRNTDPPQEEYIPRSFDEDRLTLQGIYRPNQFNPFCLWYYEEPNVPRTAQGFGALIAQEKMAYGNSRYLYDQLVDGGSTDEVVQEISSTWPNEAWELRTYLLGLSPFLSTHALKEAVNKAYFPMAMKAEVCIANPDATQEQDFVKWLEFYADEPMPTYLIDLIKASWDEKTYRTDLEMEMADHHTELTQTAHELLDLYSEPGSTATLDDKRWVWQQLHTTAARYAEVALLLGAHEYTKAIDLLDSMAVNYDLEPEQEDEQERMADYVGLLHAARLDGRSEAALTSAEVTQLVALRGTAHDRASNWINNVLCHYYQDCQAPYTGGGEVVPKRLRASAAAKAEERTNTFVTAPNPAEAWVTFTYAFKTAHESATVLVQDALGRQVAMLPMANEQGQLVLDTREMGAGVYTVSYTNKGRVEQLDKLVVR